MYKNFKSKRLLIKFLLATSVFPFLKIPLLNNKEKNKDRNNLDIDFWNYKFNILNINQQYSDEIQQAFYKTFILSKNNENKNAELKNYFLINYFNFDKNYQDKIIEKF